MYLRLRNVNKENEWRIMTNHFSFSTDLIFLFSFLFLFNIFLNSFVVLKNNLLAASSEKKSHLGTQTETSNFFSLAICQVFAYEGIAQGSQYAWMWLDMPNGRVLNMPGQRLNMPGQRFWLNKPPVLNTLQPRIWQCCEYTRVTKSAEYAWISLSMP